MQRALALTTINGPIEPLQRLAGAAAARGIRFIIAGDTKSPPDFRLEGCEYLSIDEQVRRFPELCAVLPTRHYARKNTAYLAAMKQGAELIQETDDDNLPYDSFFDRVPESLAVQAIESASPWYNVYREYDGTGSWPRGFPLEYTQAAQAAKSRIQTGVRGFILQGLADENPDVDAVYRLTRPLPLSFRQGPPCMLMPGAWCPFNSQNTIFRRRAFPLLYLPSFCSFRMTDIWRSFVAQRCLWEWGEGVVFHAATVRQERNEHDLLRDFAEEVPGYLANDRIRRLLDDLSLRSSDARENVRACYEALVAAEILPAKEMEILRRWLSVFDEL
jgi:hypothetical protein